MDKLYTEKKDELMLAALGNALLSNGEENELIKALNDDEYKQELYQKYNIKYKDILKNKRRKDGK